MDDSQSTVNHLMPCSRAGPHPPASPHPLVSDSAPTSQLNHVHLLQPSMSVPSQYFGARLDASRQLSEASQQRLKQSAAQTQSHAVARPPSGDGSITGDGRKALSGDAPPRDVSRAPPGDGIRPPCGGVSKAAPWGLGQATPRDPPCGGVTKATSWGLSKATPGAPPWWGVSRSPTEHLGRPQDVIKASFGANPTGQDVSQASSATVSMPCQASAQTDQLKHNGASGEPPQAVMPLGALPKQSSVEQRESLAGQESISNPSVTQQLPGKLSWPPKQPPMQTQAAQHAQTALSGRRPVSEKLPTASQVHMQQPSLPALYI